MATIDRETLDRLNAARRSPLLTDDLFVAKCRSGEYFHLAQPKFAKVHCGAGRVALKFELTSPLAYELCSKCSAYLKEKLPE